MTCPNPDDKNKQGGLLLLTVSLLAILSALFGKSFSSDLALFSNDSPLAAFHAHFVDLPGAFFGVWNDLYWLGAAPGSYTPSYTSLFLLLAGPLGYTNFHAFFALLLLGICGWIFFRQLRFNTAACVLGSLAAALNMNFVSNAGWGLSSRSSSLAFAFLALAAIESSFGKRPIIKIILAGMATGMSVSEGGDNGAIFSLFISAYAVFRTIAHGRALPQGIALGAGRVAIMALFAGAIAAHTMTAFIGPGGSLNESAPQDSMSPAQRYNWATQWSLPKAELLRVIIPGIYGYKLDTPNGGNYWGGVGQDPDWAPGTGRLGRHSGAGEYAGVLVILLALWALAQSFRKSNSAFDPRERKLIWFWAGAALIAILLSWGRHAPFYPLVYNLPFFSTIRNPMKFMHPFHLTAMILFAYGVQGLSRLYLAKATSKTRSLLDQIKASWASGPSFEKRWTLATVATLLLACLSYLIYATSRGSLVAHLKKLEFDSTLATQMARFSAGEVGLFVVFLALSVAALIAIQSGWFAGHRSKWAGILLGAILVVDLFRANTPWISYYDYEKRYASDPVLDILKTEPYKHRVTVFPTFQGSPQQLGMLNQVYQLEWLQHHFLYYNIQALDVPQDPRPPAEKGPYLAAVGSKIARYWQLTSTRFIYALAGNFAQSMNQQLDPGGKGFTERIAFSVAQDAERTIQTTANPNGPFALVELTNALPRAVLFSNWEVITNDQATLSRLGSSEFNPLQSVLVSQDIPPPATTNAGNGTVEFVSYKPRHIELKAESSQPGILLLNDRYHHGWSVSVDGKPAPMLRCNYLMRGVQLEPGTHSVVFSYTLKSTTFYITLISVIAGLLLCGFLAISSRARPAPDRPRSKADREPKQKG